MLVGIRAPYGFPGTAELWYRENRLRQKATVSTLVFRRTTLAARSSLTDMTASIQDWGAFIIRNLS